MGVEFNLKGLTEFREDLLQASNKSEIQRLNHDIVNTMASVYIRQAKKETPVGPRSVKFMSKGKIKTKRFDSEKTRQSWGVGRYSINGNTGKIEVYNTSSYASFLNDGHRQEVGRFLPWIGEEVGGVRMGAKLKTPWVDGQYMHEKAERLVNKKSRRIMELAFKKWIEKGVT